MLTADGEAWLHGTRHCCPEVLGAAPFSGMLKQGHQRELIDSLWRLIQLGIRTALILHCLPSFFRDIGWSQYCLQSCVLQAMRRHPCLQTGEGSFGGSRWEMCQLGWGPAPPHSSPAWTFLSFACSTSHYQWGLRADCDSSSGIFVLAVPGRDAVDKEVTHFHCRISLAQCIYILFNFTPILTV